MILMRRRSDHWADGSQPLLPRNGSTSLPGRNSPTRLISHSSRTPLAPARAPAPSRRAVRGRAAVAAPVLIRKLQCISETMAPPIRRPRQPAASMSCQALLAGRIGEGRAAGLLADRLGRLAMLLDRVHLRLDRRRGRPARPAKTRVGEDEIVGRRGVAVGEAHLGVGEDDGGARCGRPHAPRPAARASRRRWRRRSCGAPRRRCRECRERRRSRRGPARARRRRAACRAAPRRRGCGSPASRDRLAEALRRQADDDARDAAVADEEIRADADDGYRDFRTQLLQERAARSSASAGWNRSSAGPPTRNQVNGASARVRRDAGRGCRRGRQRLVADRPASTACPFAALVSRRHRSFASCSGSA